MSGIVVQAEPAHCSDLIAVSWFVSLTSLFSLYPRWLFAPPLMLLAECAFAHLETPSAYETAWRLEPWVVGCLALVGLLYAAGARKLWSKAGVGRGLTRWQASAFIAGWLIVVVALISPLDALGGQLFSAHMVQHELLMVVAAPLFVLARPLEIWTWSLPSSWRGDAGRIGHWPPLLN
ncbi:MAG TPA: cytochrome c oxidase assembly protein, partial [Burkholderiales bacterium]|nr:cytochrome c oxidase assembly protein [Burkholderiales bacterium]